MQIGVVSDTHGHLRGTRDAVRMLASLEVEAVLHCGDIGTPEVIECFSAGQPATATNLRSVPAGCRVATHFVFGNCDYDRDVLRAAMHAHGLICHDEFGQVDLAGRHIALLHGHDARRMQQVLTGGNFDLVCTGHTHVANVERRGEMLLVNPGAIYRANPHTIAVVDLVTMEATVVPL